MDLIISYNVSLALRLVKKTLLKKELADGVTVGKNFVYNVIMSSYVCWKHCHHRTKKTFKNYLTMYKHIYKVYQCKINFKVLNNINV